jgi:uncharacterized membrane protein
MAFCERKDKGRRVNRFMNSQEHTSIPTISSLSPRPDSEIKGVPIQKLPKAGSGDDKLMSNIIGWLLQGGVVVSSAIILIGLILLLLSPQGLANTGIAAFPHSLGSVGIGLQALQPQAVITLGLLLLIATPVLRVAVSVVAFALEHDRRYVIITLIVLTILIISFTLGRGGA